MKIKDVTDQVLLEYLRLEKKDATVMIACDAAKQHILNYTGMKEKDLNKHDDLTMAYLILVAHFYDNRQYASDRDYSNKAVELILSGHRSNLIPSGG